MKKELSKGDIVVIGVLNKFPDSLWPWIEDEKSNESEEMHGSIGVIESDNFNDTPYYDVTLCEHATSELVTHWPIHKDQFVKIDHIKNWRNYWEEI